jgi:hypothetical protein
VDVKPFEAASGEKAVSCATNDGCTATVIYNGQSGVRDINIRYFDQIDGVSKFRALLNEQLLDQWEASNDIPTRKPDGHSSSRRLIRGVPLRDGDRIRIEGVPDRGERAALDYIEVLASR